MFKRKIHEVFRYHEYFKERDLDRNSTSICTSVGGEVSWALGTDSSLWRAGIVSSGARGAAQSRAGELSGWAVIAASLIGVWRLSGRARVAEG
jgi:sulfite exporter TauE/SafE